MRFIITADDFGRSHEINQAVLRAHREGFLTSASLMVAGDAALEAAEMARANPTLAVGLHLVLVDGPAVSPADRLAGLVASSGRFPDSPARLGILYSLSVSARRKITAEIAAQFQRFAQFGLPLSHVDGHQHMHLHPAVLPNVIPLARQYGACGIRIVRDDLALALGHSRTRMLTQAVWAANFAWMSEWGRRRLRNQPILTADRVYGLMQSGRMSESYVLDVLNACERSDRRDRIVELYFHPTSGPRTDEFGPNPEDLDTLLSPRVLQRLRDMGATLTTYLRAAESAQQRPAGAARNSGNSYFCLACDAGDQIFLGKRGRGDQPPRREGKREEE